MLLFFTPRPALLRICLCVRGQQIAAAAVTVSSGKANFPMCATLFRNPFSHRNAMGRANNFDAAVDAGDSSQCCSEVACSSPHVAGRVFSRLGGVWPRPLVMQQRQRRPSSQYSRPCSSAAITRSSSPIWVLELSAHVMHEPMRLATLERTSMRVRPTQNGPGSYFFWVENRCPEEKPSTAITMRESQHPRICFARRSFHRRKGSRFLDGATQNASRPRTTLSSEPNDRGVAVCRKLRERSVSH